MSLFEKFKLLLALNKLVKEINKMEKLKDLLGKLDGLKSLLGLLMILAYHVAPVFGHNLPEVILNTGYGFLGIGLVHKLNKGSDIIKKVIPVLSAVIAVLDKKKEEKK